MIFRLVHFLSRVGTRKVKTAFLLTLPVVVSVATLTADHQPEWSPDQAEVWRTVETRIDAWARNDYETYLSLHHERWRRFSIVTSELTSRDDVARFWRGMKDSEKVHAIELTPIAVEVYAGGSAAIAHYTIVETLEWTAETQRRASGRLMEKGRVYRVPARFSDVYVKEDGRSLYAGGYRDLTCDIMPESPFPCLDRRAAPQQGVTATTPFRSADAAQDADHPGARHYVEGTAKDEAAIRELFARTEHVGSEFDVPRPHEPPTEVGAIAPTGSFPCGCTANRSPIDRTRRPCGR